MIQSNCKNVAVCYYKEYKRKEQECEELKRLIAKQKNAKIQLSKLKDKQYKEFCDMKQALIEVKDVLNFYANSKIGEEQNDGTYKVVEKTVCALDGACVIYYDPRPAKEALKKISEVEDDR